MDLVKVRQQATTSSNALRTWKMVRDVYVLEGVAGLYRGVVPTMKRGGLLTATQLGTYDHIKHAILKYNFLSEGALLHFCSGCIAGLAVALVTSPVDTVRTRLMNQPVSVTGNGEHYSGMLDCFVKTTRREGVLASYKGFTAQWLRVGPHTTISLVCFEFLRHLWGFAAI
jgi:hypothetical protein